MIELEHFASRNANPADCLFPASAHLIPVNFNRLFTVAGSGNMLKYGLSLCFLSLCPVAAQAAADPFDIFKPFVSDTVTYDDNLFLRSKLATISNALGGRKTFKDDVINQATVGSAVNYTLGRQRFNLNLRVSDNRFVNNQFLNHISTNDRAVWQWELGKQLSGDIGYAYNRMMSGFTNTTFFGLNMVSSNNAFGYLNYAWDPRWNVRTGLTWSDYTNSTSDRAFLDQQISTALAGVTYTMPSGNLTAGPAAECATCQQGQTSVTPMYNLPSVSYTTPWNNSTGLQYSYTDGKYPNRRPNARGVFVNNDYQQHDIMALLTWRITEKTSFNGNVSYAIRQYNDSSRDFNGETFDLTLNWIPTSKIMLALSGWRRLGSWVDVTAGYVITEGFSISPMWRPSPKLALTANFSRLTLDYTGDPSLVSATRNETYLSGQVSVVYMPVSGAEITLGYQGSTRNSTLPLGDYAFNRVFTSVMLRF